MDVNLRIAVEGYMCFLRNSYTGDTIPTCVYKILIEDNLEPAKSLGTEQYREVLNCVANFSVNLYEKANRLRPYARHYAILLVKELTRLNSDNNVISILSMVRKYDADGFDLVLDSASKDVRTIVYRAERVKRFIRDAIYGSLTGAILGAIIIAVRSWLNI